MNGATRLVKDGEAQKKMIRTVEARLMMPQRGAGRLAAAAPTRPPRAS
jgi:hypothetical protein